MTYGFNAPLNNPLHMDAFSYNAPLRILHFVADDSPELQPAACELVNAANEHLAIEALLVLDRSFNRNANAPSQSVKHIDSRSKAGRAYEFYRLCREFQPDAVFIHSANPGNWCCYASLRAGVRHIMASRDQHRIPYGINLSPFAKADEVPLALRIPGVIMSSGFVGDYHLQLIRAIACLREVRLYPRIFLTGPGTSRDHNKTQQLCNALGLENQVRIAPHCSNLPFLLMHHQLAVVGNPAQQQPLAAQAMAAGCALVGITRDDAPTIIQNGNNGILFTDDSPELLAEKLEELLSNITDTQQLALAARQRAVTEFSLARMVDNYAECYSELVSNLPILDANKVA